MAVQTLSSMLSGVKNTYRGTFTITNGTTSYNITLPAAVVLNKTTIQRVDIGCGSSANSITPVPFYAQLNSQTNLNIVLYVNPNGGTGSYEVQELY